MTFIYLFISDNFGRLVIVTSRLIWQHFEYKKGRLARVAKKIQSIAKDL